MSGPDEIRFEPEGQNREYKGSFRWNPRTLVKDKALQTGVGRSVAGFLNAEGGILVIGVRDEDVVGVLEEAEALYSDKHLDRYELEVREYLSKALFPPAIENYRITFPILQGVTVCVIEVQPCPTVTYLVEKTNAGTVHNVYLRDGNRTKRLDDLARDRWVTIRNGGQWVLGVDRLDANA